MWKLSAGRGKGKLKDSMLGRVSFRRVVNITRRVRSMLTTLRLVFTSGFREGRRLNEDNSGGRRVIQSGEDPHTLHVILHYLYTGRVSFDTNPNLDGGDDKSRPTLDAEMIYEAADRFLLQGLKAKALTFLARMCDEHNITARLFGDFAQLCT